MADCISACGIDCGTCPFCGKTCEGCYAVQGKPFWTAERLQGNPCPLYDCAVTVKQYGSCAPCEDLPCKIFTELKDPSMSEEEHLAGIDRRVAALREKNRSAD